MRAYALQDNGLDTVDANHALGFDTDERLFLPAARILQALDVSKIQLITNNPDKISQLEQHGIAVTARVPLVLATNPHNHNYLNQKPAPGILLTKFNAHASHRRIPPAPKWRQNRLPLYNRRSSPSTILAHSDAVPCVQQGAWQLLHQQAVCTSAH